MSRVAIYARVSTKEQSTETQVLQLTAYCRSRGWTAVAVFRDDGISGVRDNRPELDRLRQRMIAGEFSAVVVSKMDRFGRSLGMILRFWDEADAAGTRVIVIDQGIDTSTPAGRLQRNMLAALAEFERELILERTQAGVARARALGKKFGAPRRISETTAREVRERRARGESLRLISRRMNLKLGGVRSVLRRSPGRMVKPQPEVNVPIADDRPARALTAHVRPTRRLAGVSRSPGGPLKASALHGHGSSTLEG